MGGVLCVGGGVLLATVFVHMLPEVRESLNTAYEQLSEDDNHHGHVHSDNNRHHLEDEHDHTDEHHEHSDEHHEHSDEHHEHSDRHHDHSDEHHSYPYAELVTCAGFFLIYFVEAVVHRIFIGVHGSSSGSHGHSHAIPPGMLQKSDDNKEDQDVHNDSGSSDLEKYAISTPNSSTTADSGVDNPAFRIETEGLNGDINDAAQPAHLDSEIANRKCGKDNLNSNNGVKITLTTSTGTHTEHPDSAVWNKSPFSKKYKTHPPTGSKEGTALGLNGRSNVYNVSSATLTSYTSYNNDGGEHSLDESSLPNHHGLPTVDSDIRTKNHGDRERQVLFSVRNFLIVLALSVHSIFEGMAIGLQLSVQDVWKLFLAVSLHDVPVHFCVGMEMFNGGIRKLHIIIYFLILGIITPIGIIIGIVVTEHAGEGDGTQTLIIGILQGLAGGTLLYITFYEVLEREKLAKAGMTGILGCFLLTCGFAFMAGLEAAGGHSHGVVKESRHDHDNFSTKEQLFMGSDHGHSHGAQQFDQSSDMLNKGITKYGNQGMHNDHDHHHIHEHEEHHNDPNHYDEHEHDDSHDHEAEDHEHHGDGHYDYEEGHSHNANDSHNHHVGDHDYHVSDDHGHHDSDHDHHGGDHDHYDDDHDHHEENHGHHGHDHHNQNNDHNKNSETPGHHSDDHEHHSDNHDQHGHGQSHDHNDE